MLPPEESPILPPRPIGSRSAFFDWDLVFLNPGWLYAQRKDGAVREFAQGSLKWFVPPTPGFSPMKMKAEYERLYNSTLNLPSCIAPSQGYFRFQPSEPSTGIWPVWVSERWVEGGSLSHKSFAKLRMVHKFNLFSQVTVTGSVPHGDCFNFGPGAKNMARNCSSPTLDLWHDWKINLCCCKPLKLWGHLLPWHNWPHLTDTHAWYLCMPVPVIWAGVHSPATAMQGVLPKLLLADVGAAWQLVGRSLRALLYVQGLLWFCRALLWELRTHVCIQELQGH